LRPDAPPTNIAVPNVGRAIAEREREREREEEEEAEEEDKRPKCASPCTAA